VHSFNSQAVRQAAFTPTRNEAAQARVARRSTHSEHAGTSAKYVPMLLREGYARLRRDAEWAPRHRGASNPVFLLVVGGESDGGVSCPLWRSLGVAAKVRIPVSPSIGTYYADVPACSECVERRATHACATSSRIGVRAACLTAWLSKECTGTLPEKNRLIFCMGSVNKTGLRS